MTIRPLPGQCLLRLLPPDTSTSGGLVLPDSATTAARGEKQFPAKAQVVAVGTWRKTKDGYSVLPDFRPGQVVLVSHYVGSRLTRDIGENLRLCRVDDVLAVLQNPQEMLS